jgi:hypothetical protein
MNEFHVDETFSKALRAELVSQVQKTSLPGSGPGCGWGPASLPASDFWWGSVRLLRGCS